MIERARLRPSPPVLLEMNAATKSSLIESPWFWAHLFSIFCLVVLMVAAPKIKALTAARVRNAAMRRSVYGRAATGEKVQETVPHSETDSGTMLPVFYLIFGVTAIVTWVQVWRTVLRKTFEGASDGDR